MCSVADEYRRDVVPGVLILHDRTPINSLKLDGDRRLFEQLSAWDTDEQDVTMRHLVRPGACLPPTATITPWWPRGC